MDFEYLTQNERDELFRDLSEKQREFIDNHLKRGRKTVFANVLAKEKASTATNNIEDVASKWSFLDYNDAGPNWKNKPELFCECGKTLRYQYIIENLETKEIKKFGINHLEEHTGIPAYLVNDIKKGIERIDYEMDEVLIKIRQGWSLKTEGITEIPENIDVPKDIQDHINNYIPLLKRQVVRLKGLIKEYLHKEKLEQLNNLLNNNKNQNIIEQNYKYTTNNKESKNTNNSHLRTNNLEWVKVSQDKKINLEDNLQLGTLEYIKKLQKPLFGAKDVCNELINNYGATSDTYSTGRPIIYPNVCIFLDFLVEKGMVESIGEKWVNDRLYKLIENNKEEKKDHENNSLIHSQISLFE